MATENQPTQSQYSSLMKNEPWFDSFDNYDTNQDVDTYTDWNGPNDPENPLNWSKAMIAFHVFVPAFEMLVV